MSKYERTSTQNPAKLSSLRGTLQRKCDCGQHTIAGGECEGCSKKHPPLQRATRNLETETQNSGGVPEIVHEVLRSSGQPLDTTTRAFFEPRFGYDFSKVRVHTDARAAESARAVNALAYTVGKEVVFGAGEYSPDTSAGLRLFAHELTHVVQQEGGTPEKPLANGRISARDDLAERDADEVSDKALSSSAVFAAKGSVRPSAQLHRQEKAPTASIQPPQVSESKDLSLYPYVDDFDSAYYDLDYRHEGSSLSKWLRLNYSDGSTIDLHMDQIVGQSMTPEAVQEARKTGRVGDGGRAFPSVMNPGTTPRLWEAKRSAIEAMEQYNFEFMTATLPAVFFIITMPLSVMGMGKGPGPTAVRRGLTRGVSAVKPVNVFDDTLKAALKPNTMRHIFGKAQHGLDPLVKELGGEEKVITEVVKGLSKANLPQAGLIEDVPVLVAGRTVFVRGAVVNGVPRISTIFIKP